MRLAVQKRIAADIMNCSPKRVWFDDSKLDEIKESITKTDLRALVKKGIIQEKRAKTNSRGRARKRQIQRSKGKRRGHGKRKGVSTARLPKKENWMNKVRLQRDFLRSLKEKKMLSNKDFRDLYQKSKGGFFRSKRHIKLYIEEHNMVKK